MNYIFILEGLMNYSVHLQINCERMYHVKWKKGGMWYLGLNHCFQSFVSTWLVGNIGHGSLHTLLTSERLFILTRGPCQQGHGFNCREKTEVKDDKSDSFSSFQTFLSSILWYHKFLGLLYSIFFSPLL